MGLGFLRPASRGLFSAFEPGGFEVNAFKPGGVVFWEFSSTNSGIESE